MNSNHVPPHVIRALSAFLAAGVLLGFVVLAAVGIYDSVVATEEPVYGETLVYVTTGISALVGGVVAAAFGAQPSPGHGQVGAPTIFDELGSHAFQRTGRFIGSAYAVAYVVVGATAVVVWVVRPAGTVDHVAALASTFLGLALIIVAAYFRQPAGPVRGHDGPVPAPRSSDENRPSDPSPAIAS